MVRIFYTILFLLVIGFSNCSKKKNNIAFWPVALSGDKNNEVRTTSATEGNNSNPGLEKVATPTFNLASGHYTSPQKITITTTTNGAAIYYTLDGQNPTNNSNLYSSDIPIWIIAGKQIKAIAIKSGMTNSDISNSGNYSYSVVKTGQITSFTVGDDGSLQSGILRSYTGPIQNTTYTSDYVTIDNYTGLVWKTCSQGQSGANCTAGSALTMNWQDAQTGANGCNALNSVNNGNGYAGKKNWRLPSVQEFFSILDAERNSAPTINTSAFPNIPIGNYYFWTSTDYGQTPATDVYAFSVQNGTIGNGYKLYLNYVQCVSGTIRNETKNYFVNGNETVIDNTTGLIWQRCSAGLNNDLNCSGSASLFTWTGALTYCNSLSLGGKTWRLPNIKELNTLTDYSKVTNPTIDTNVFPNTPSDNGFFSSTTYAFNTTSAWFSSVTGGGYGFTFKTGSFNVRCVSGP